MNAEDFMIDWFFPILMMVSVGVIIIVSLIIIMTFLYKLWRK